MQIKGREAGQILTAILQNLYLKTSSPDVVFPIKVIDSPEIAKSIFMGHDIFVRNYGFLEYLSKGRFTSYGEEWKQRASITQSFFSRPQTLVDGPFIEAIYRKHFLIYINTSTPNLYETFVDGAMEVISQLLGIDHPIPWPGPLINSMRERLIDLQAMAWMNSDQHLVKESEGELHILFNELQGLWEKDLDVTNLLNVFAASGKPVPQFNPAGELAQILLAATETTASSLLWVTECLSRHIDILRELDREDALEYFMDEALRLFPPVPFVTRACL
jgi:cytochrome P450